MIMTFVFYLEHHINERIKRVLRLLPEVWFYAICQFIHSPIVHILLFLQKVLYPSVVVGYTFLYDIPFIFTILTPGAGLPVFMSRI